MVANEDGLQLHSHDDNPITPDLTGYLLTQWSIAYEQFQVFK